jgi:hypothetical protein
MGIRRTIWQGAGTYTKSVLYPSSLYICCLFLNFNARFFLSTFKIWSTVGTRKPMKSKCVTWWDFEDRIVDSGGAAPSVLWQRGHASNGAVQRLIHTVITGLLFPFNNRTRQPLKRSLKRKFKLTPHTGIVSAYIIVTFQILYNVHISYEWDLAERWECLNATVKLRKFWVWSSDTV